MIYLQLFLLALVVIYIVDLSGFTDAWKAGFAKWLKVSKVKEFPPFDCGKCMTWWCCLVWIICTGDFNLYTIAFSALLSFLSVPLGQLLVAIREDLNWLVNKLFIRYE